MIKANELRIGNLLIDNLTKSYLRVSSLDEDPNKTVFTVIDRSKYPLPDGWKAEPIPLTEEWLERFGITNLNGIEVKGGVIFTELKNKEVGIGGSSSQCSSEIFYAKCEYVHQLQNLYFALTGEELKLKES